MIMGDPFVGIVHPCKVYNIRTLGLPYLYIGPTESHISDLSPTFTARHGDVETVVRHIQAGLESGMSRVGQPDEAATHSQDHVVARLVRTLEGTALASAPLQPKTASAQRSHQF